MLHVPYQGSASAMIDLVNNNVQVGFDSVAATKSFIDSKRLKIVAAATQKRLPMFPQTPTIAESGFPDFEVSAWTGVSVPAGTPRSVCERLNTAIVKIVRSPKFIAQIEALGAVPRSSSIEEFRSFLRTEDERWRKLVISSNATVE
jgi:tripartite-type tricarboxylate transporter receptor subunit TctC